MLNHIQTSPVDPTRILILGANGFIAKELATTLQSKNINHLALSRTELDLTQTASASTLARLLRPNDSVVMTAALTPEHGNDISTLMKNLIMSENVSSAIMTSPCKQLIYISSDAVYNSCDSLISETTRPDPKDLYSTMHQARERILAQATSKTKTPYCILRPCSIYGKNDPHNSYGPNRFARSARSNRVIKLFGKGEEKRDHVFIDDVIAIIYACVLHKSIGLLNIVSGKSFTFNHIAEQIIKICKTQIEVVSVKRDIAITHRSFDNSLLIRAFPTLFPTNLNFGLSKIII